MNDFKRMYQFTDNYTTIRVKGIVVSKGARDPLTRMEHVPIDLTNKTVIDLGCNCGGTLYAVHEQIKHGYGYELNQEAVNNALTVKQDYKVDNLDFTQVDLQETMPDWPDYDVLFCFSIARWVKNWKDILEKLDPKVMIFEAHGKPAHLDEQLKFLHSKFTNVQHLHTARETKVRSLYLCEK